MLERREVSRYKTNLRSAYKVPDCLEEKNYQCSCADISTKGALLILGRPLSVGKELDITLSIPRCLAPIFIRAQVVWQTEQPQDYVTIYPTGVYFIRIKERDRVNIIDFLKEAFPEEILKQWWNGV